MSVPHPSAIRHALLAAAVSVLSVALTGQEQPPRPSAALTKLPSLERELWPGDFTGDGIPDIVAAQAPNVLVLLRGNGDGSFLPPVVIGDTLGEPRGVGDVNGDGHLDVIAGPSTASTTSAPSILSGNGDGTFGGPWPLTGALRAPVAIVDLDRDGRVDLVGPGVNDLLVYWGLAGPFAFSGPQAMAVGANVQGLATADFNGDAFPDVAAIAFGGGTASQPPVLRLFLNGANRAFAATSFALDRPGLAVVAADLNDDGVVDLITASGRGFLPANYFDEPGIVTVRLGNGDGTFQSPATFETNSGPRTLAVGDFNADGRLDVASGHQSSNADSPGCNGDEGWDSISMLAGRGDGSLAPAASLALGDRETGVDDTVYRRRHHRLHARDLNADGWMDLIASPGAILLAQPAGENRPPVADAGPDRLEPLQGFEDDELFGAATDPDHDWLTFRWTDESGRVIGTVARPCFTSDYVAAQTFTLTVSDGRGGVSTDSMIWTFSSGTPTLPPSWNSADVGAVGAGGQTLFGTLYGAPTFTVTGSGGDIWGTTDAFHFAHVPISGNFEITALVHGVQHVDDWSKAGLMIRESLAAGARHASLFATPVNGLAFQRRREAGGATVHTGGPDEAIRVELRLRREGDVVTAWSRRFPNTTWTEIGTDTLSGLADSVYVGLAVTSHRAGTTATATFSNVLVSAFSAPLPVGWESADINTSVGGRSTFDGTSFVVEGSGHDIWGQRDSFHYAFTRLPGNGTLTARVTGLTGPDPWSKAGLMIRDSREADAVHHFLLMSGANGLAYQRRLNNASATTHTALPSPGGPVWFRIERIGGMIRLWYSSELNAPAAWQLVAESTFPAGEALIGLAVTSHAEGLFATGTFDQVDVSYEETGAPLWVSENIRAVGTGTVSGTSALLTATGADVWGTTDGFRYAYRALAGDGSITARVASLAGPHPWSKAGVMVRATTQLSSAHAFMLLSRDHGLAFQRRVSAGTITTHTAGAWTTAPVWLRLTRTGELVTAAFSSDGTTWTDVGSDQLAIGSGPILVGLALTSHDTGAFATAAFDDIVVTEFPASE